jgi:hypothetical protein
MQIIWSQEAADRLSSSQTVLELETFAVHDDIVKTFCVVPAEKVINEITILSANVELHKEFIQALTERNYSKMLPLAKMLLGRFGGELDSFYEEMIERAKLNQ